MADQLQFTINRAVDANGDPAPGAKAYFYQSGTNTLRTVYTTDDASIAHASPVVADSEGVFPAVFANGACKVLITDASDVTLTGYPMDPVFLVPTASAGASRITFKPTVEIPATNVQAAIERVQENIVAPLADLGIGVTGNAEVLANLDATNTASGFYRFSTATSGTFPTGVVASDDGIVGIFRDTSANGFMFLIVRGETTIHRRSLVGGAWDTWTDGSTTDATWAAGTDAGQATISPAQLRAAMNASGAPPIYACRAWVSFTGTDTVTIRASGNVSSVTDNGTGDYTVNFAEDMPDADYTVVATPTRARTDRPNWVYHIQPNDPADITASSVRLRGGYVSGTNDGSYNAAVDFPQVSVAIFR